MLEEISDYGVESFGLIPLHPVGALVEQVKLRAGDKLKE
jgi:hypothetical protein